MKDSSAQTTECTSTNDQLSDSMGFFYSNDTFADGSVSSKSQKPRNEVETQTEPQSSDSGSQFAELMYD